MIDDAVDFHPFEPDDLDEWLVGNRSDYVAQLIASGDSVAEAEANAASSFETLVPGGRPAAGQLIGRVVWRDRPVGILWIGPAKPNDSQRWWVWDIAIDAEFRGHGLGRATMLLAEQLAAEHGATTLGLNVFAHNTVARSLYSSLGYEDSAVQMRKPL